MFIVCFLTVDELTIDPFSDNKNITHESKEFFQAQGEWELLSIDTSKSNATLLDNLQDLLIYKVQNTEYRVGGKTHY